MLAVARGDMRAFEQIVRRHQSFAWSIAFRFIQNREIAEDLVQDAFLKLLTAAPNYRPTATFRTYFSCILSRLCLDHLGKKRPIPCDELPDMEDPTPHPDRQLIIEEETVALKAAIALLPPNQRLAIILRYYENYNYREIAEALETTEKAVERLLARGRATLGNILKDWG
jgi:RNA polymerase sigma-70 factor (ECF subfamily)